VAIPELIANKVLLIECVVLLNAVVLNVLILTEMLATNNLLDFVQNPFPKDE
jgi:hypothetical protein